MMSWNRSNRRWQFSLGALFGAFTLAALFSAALAGALGAPVREGVMQVATMTLVVGAGLVYYVLFILVLCSPVMLAVAALKLAAKMIGKGESVELTTENGKSTEGRGEVDGGTEE